MIVIRNTEDLKSDIVREPGAKQTTLKRLIDTPDGADRYVMTLFHLEANGSTPPHYHDWEHEILVLEGSCQLQKPHENEEITIKTNDVIFIPRNEPHGFYTNEGQECKFIVVAPTERPPISNYFLSDEPYQYTNK